MVENNNTNNQQHQKRHSWLCSTLSKTGEGIASQQRTGSSGYDLRVDAKGRPPVTPANRGGGALGVASGNGGEGEESVASIELGRRRKESF